MTVLGEAPRIPSWEEIHNPPRGESITCHQAQLAYEGRINPTDAPPTNRWGEGQDSELLHCGQANLALTYYDHFSDWDDPGKGGLYCPQAKIAARLAHPDKVAWWGDRVATFGDPAFTWSGKPIEHPAAP